MDGEDDICIPGTCLSLAEEYVSGHGTYEKNGYIYSCLAGYVTIRNLNNGKKSISVIRGNEKTVIPLAGSIVTARQTVLKEPFNGIIRKEDVRATEKDKIEIYKCFRPGDIVLARVLSLGDANAYVLSTAENELGVVTAQSEAGVMMVPISWNEMQCPKTCMKEYRKVAKVVPENASEIKK